MFTRDERRALLFLAATAALGAGVRAVRAGADGPPGASLIAPGLSSGNLAAQESSARRTLAFARPLEPGQRVDLDHADAAEIERLPRIGPELARRIVDERSANGPFGSLDGLQRVRGVGPGILSGLGRTASFSGVPAPESVGQVAAGSQNPKAPGARRSGTGKQQRLTARAVQGATQGSGPAIATMPPPPPSPPQRAGVVTVLGQRQRRARTSVRAAPAAGMACPSLPLSINEASTAELTCLPGIGPGLATQIVSWRNAHGRFAEVNDLEQVPGIGPARIQRLLPFVRAP